ncbi:MAG: hypothetical protein IT158_30025 [Bryobacterales bacterium]|nr:hypothetical protein [Bryobacterales bacterium]
MQPLSTAELLDFWEQARALSPLERALTLLARACPEIEPEALAQWSIGQRDSALMTLRERAFGPEVACLADCPHCGGRLDISFRLDEVRARPAAGGPWPFRLPNSLDLAAASEAGTPEEARRILMERCGITEDLIGQAAEADPLADVELGLQCPACEQWWEAPFDIVRHFWSEIDAWARRVLREVHVLASAYGWSEPEILALSPWRRQLYLEMASG